MSNGQSSRVDTPASEILRPSEAYPIVIIQGIQVQPHGTIQIGRERGQDDNFHTEITGHFSVQGARYMPGRWLVPVIDPTSSFRSVQLPGRLPRQRNQYLRPALENPDEESDVFKIAQFIGDVMCALEPSAGNPSNSGTTCPKQVDTACPERADFSNDRSTSAPSAAEEAEEDSAPKVVPHNIPANAEAVPWLILRAFTFSEQQVWSEVLTPHFSNFLTDYRNGWDLMPEYNCDAFENCEQRDIIELAMTRWLQTFNKLRSCLDDDDWVSEDDMEFFDIAMSSFRSCLVNKHTAGDITLAVSCALRILALITALVSDVALLLSDDCAPSLEEMSSLKPRSEYLDLILESAPKDADLPKYIEGTLAALPKDDKDCRICLEPLGEGINYFLLAHVAGTAAENFHPTTWIRLSDDDKGLKVRDGLQNVPFKMDCGHVFCAGCVEGLFKNTDARLQCPMRDSEYGVQRSKVVGDMEYLHTIFYLGLDG